MYKGIFRLLVASEIGKFKGQKLRKRHFMIEPEIKLVSVLVTFARSKTQQIELLQRLTSKEIT